MFDVHRRYDDDRVWSIWIAPAKKHRKQRHRKTALGQSFFCESAISCQLSAVSHQLLVFRYLIKYFIQDTKY
jgi:hypothetical protein